MQKPQRKVASFTEAWIEINLGKNENEGEQVASFTEAWIEISYKLYTCTSHSSPPSRRRGLKYPVKWSEISCFLRRLLRGGMD